MTSLAARAARHGIVSRRLAALGDAQAMALLEEARSAGVGIGGTTGEVTVDGVPVFVKRVPLTDLERRPEHVGSTANLFQLPMFYQYGIGSAGFGAWREVAVHTMTTRWVLENRFDGFPILYHSRVLPQPPNPIEPAELERSVTHWDGSAAVRARLTAISKSSATVVLFMEHIPHTVDSWLTAQTAPSAYALVDRGLRAGVDFMGSQGLLHFDAHFHNLLTDGHRVYFADFGLAMHSGFDFSAAEAAFFRRHSSYDRCYTAAHLTQWLVSKLLGIPWADCHDFIGDHVAGRGGIDLPEAAARIIDRDRPVAVVMGGFFGNLLNVGKRLPYPAEELGRALLEQSADVADDRGA
jgi:hypothetical protein